MRVKLSYNFNNFLKESSVYAISRIGNAESKLHKIIWLLIFLLSLVACIYQARKFLLIYWSYPVVISLQEELRQSLDFPAVTFCNLNRMKKQFESCLNIDIVERRCINSITGQNPSESKIGISERRSTLSCKTLLNNDLNNATLKKLAFLKKYTRMTPENRAFVGHQAGEMIKVCSFNMSRCFPGNFTLFQSLRYGNCYTFNGVSGNGTNSLISSLVGWTSGLDLLLDINLRHYSELSSKPGIRVTIHDSLATPNPEENGIDVSPGFETIISLKQVVHRRLPAPYRDECKHYRADMEQRNEVECMKMCLQRLNFEMCGCIDPTLISIFGLKSCNITNIKDVCCLDDIQNHASKYGFSCDCPLPCYAISYHTDLSWSALPLKQAYVNKTMREYMINEAFRMEYKLRSNLIRLRVFYSTMIREVYTQLPMFEESEIFSNLGGELSLWLGLSLFALFETVETAIYVWKLIKTSI